MAKGERVHRREKHVCATLPVFVVFLSLQSRRIEFQIQIPLPPHPPLPHSQCSLFFLATDKKVNGSQSIASRRREEKCPCPSRPHATINPNPWRPVGGRDGAAAGSIAVEEALRMRRRQAVTWRLGAFAGGGVRAPAHSWESCRSVRLWQRKKEGRQPGEQEALQQKEPRG